MERIRDAPKNGCAFGLHVADLIHGLTKIREAIDEMGVLFLGRDEVPLEQFDRFISMTARRGHVLDDFGEPLGLIPLLLEVVLNRLGHGHVYFIGLRQTLQCVGKTFELFQQ